MIKKITVSVFLLLSVMLSACSSLKEEQSSNHSGHEHETAMGDIREETSNVNELPPFMKEKPEDMQVIYLAVAQNRELLESIPCYCGCGDSVGHKDNYDCFIHENKENGSVVWDDHGTKCGVCLQIAAKSIVDYHNGKSVKEIRAEIDKTYAQGYAAPTKTKMP